MMGVGKTAIQAFVLTLRMAATAAVQIRMAGAVVVTVPMVPAVAVFLCAVARPLQRRLVPCAWLLDLQLVLLAACLSVLAAVAV